VSGLHPDEAARGDNTVEVRVYQALQPDQKSYAANHGKSRAPKEGRLLVDQRRIHLATSASKWTEFDVTKAAESWVNGGAANLGLELECRECVRRGVTLVTQDTAGSNSSISPVLNVLADVQVKGNPRQKRSSDPLHSTHRSRRTECRKDGQRCCRHTMQVVFRDLEGFGFILEPKSFDAGYCKGRCPPRYNPAHHHALLQSLIWKQNRDLAPRPCCAPNKLTDMEILHADDQDPTKLKVSQWKNIRVLECACS
jgi:integrin beta 8